MGRWPQTGVISPGLPSTAIRVDLFLSTLGNPSGDWGQAYMLAHPQQANAELVCDFHGKLLSTGGVYHYRISVNNRGPMPTAWDVDW
jgi:hypothetical protein